MKEILGALLPTLTLSCAAPPSTLPHDAEYLVVVKCARVSGDLNWFARFAEHSWVDIKRPNGWTRVESPSVLFNFSSDRPDEEKQNGTLISQAVNDISDEIGFADFRGNNNIHVVASFSGHEAKRIGERIMEVADYYPLTEDYRAWPGPNSNTFVEWLSHQVDGLAFALYPNAIGKDYGGWGRIGTTTTRTGIEFETAALGLQLGLKEGVEVHFLGLTLGVGLWPPQLKLPFLPGIPFGIFTGDSATSTELAPYDSSQSATWRGAAHLGLSWKRPSRAQSRAMQGGAWR